MTIGRTPNHEGIGLDRAGVKLDSKGFVLVDAQRKTNVAGIYAIGDIAGQPLLAHKGSKEGIVAADAIAGKKAAYDVFEVTGMNPLLDIALKLEETALSDDYFVSRKLYPNVDFYSGLIYQAMGFPVTMFPVLFAIPRTSGWIAQWEEMLLDPDQKITRPRQLYLGEARRDYVPMAKRGEAGRALSAAYMSSLLGGLFGAALLARSLRAD